MVTYDNLIQIGILIMTLVDLFLQILLVILTQKSNRRASKTCDYLSVIKS